ncbi:unnamed protein product [Cylicocyclus nassatus]|uniref:Renin receptor-like C-terminal transmembrane spanning segment domain-containing protein n=1 Tax=Cylicocyclus nassatus TaxID=53992 RepID=A0AA36H757_CYLNA|nr:unnamed protein product [Cylicocyclus nassatus]
MKEATLLLLLAAGSFASVIEFVSLPNTISLSSTSSELRSSQLPLLNENILGLTTEPVRGLQVKSDLFTRPRAVAIIEVDGIDRLEKGNNDIYKLKEGTIDWNRLDEKLASVFGADREFATLNSKGISGSTIAEEASKQKDSNVIRTDIGALREELQNVYRLASAVSARKAKFDVANSADVYRMKISGLSDGSASKQKEAVEDIRNAVNELASALKKVYGDQVIVEVVCNPVMVKDENHSQQHGEVRTKRAAPATTTDTNLERWRKALNVYKFTSTDYPAIFAIFAGLTIILALAVLYTVVGMMSMDPSKDSIIYRMTTTRMKKA